MKSPNLTPPAKGLAPNEYNGLIHAIWMIDKAIPNATDPREVAALKRYKEGLSSLFVRIG